MDLLSKTKVTVCLWSCTISSSGHLVRAWGVGICLVRRHTTLNFTCTPKTLFPASALWPPTLPLSPHQHTHTQCLARHLLTVLVLSPSRMLFHWVRLFWEQMAFTWMKIFQRNWSIMPTSSCCMYQTVRVAASPSWLRAQTPESHG